MGRKRSFRSSAEAAREMIRKNDVFHDPVAIERGGDGLEYVPERLEPKNPPARKHGRQSQGHREGE
jgi:hypothetical protein